MYDTEWYKGLSGQRTYNERAVWSLLAYFGCKFSLVDFGCGDGWTIKTAQQAGVTNCVGVEAVDAVRESAPLGIAIVIADLTKFCDLGQAYDFVLSWEVGEHLPEDAADEYCDTLARHTRDTLIFTAAKVGQGGYAHINCQDQPYWRKKIEDRGLVYADKASEDLRMIWQLCTGPLIWLPQNVQVFFRP